MFEFHKDKSRYFSMTYWVAKNHVIPFLEIKEKIHVCEIGCGEAGVLKAFLDEGHTGVGIELMTGRAALAKINLKEEIQLGRAEIINKNIYDLDEKDPKFKFDLIVLKDVIEHIPDQQRFIFKLKDLLKEGGTVFFGYPPWWMPFGGHQQVCNNKILSKLPWFHLLPVSIYASILKIGGESESTIKELLEIKETGITIEKLKSYLKKADFNIKKEKHWLLNPIYVVKFNLKPIRSLINIPYLRNFYITAHYVWFV